ncbi:hypothetical protein [Dactylosporangium sp. CA-233914]|uniref:hypothetical protein n=1 Tax=Dactylosporangium sp. CA-233914 TaxID=3239934 RepID=UPI003D8C32BF
MLAGSCFQVAAAAQRPHSILTRSPRLVQECTPLPGQNQSNSQHPDGILADGDTDPLAQAEAWAVSVIKPTRGGADERV